MVGEQIVILAILSLFSVSGSSIQGNLEADPFCTPFVYEEGKGTFTDGACVSYDSADKVNYVKPCDEGLVCTADEESNYNCVAESTEKAYHGESCSSNDDCASGTCTNKLCVGIASGSACNEDVDCAAGLYCDTASDKKTCVALVAAEGTCLRDEQCTYGYYCDIAPDAEPAVGVCAEYFNTISGDAVDSCMDGYFDLQCQSAFCVEITDSQTQEKTYECSEVFSLRNPDTPCTSEADCAGENADKSDSMTTECLCGFSQNGYGYCKLLPGDEPYAKLIELYTEWYDSTLEKNCNTARRGSLECAEAQWDYEKFFALQYYLLKTMYWHQIWDVQTEVQMVFNSDYWAAKEEYELHDLVECPAFKTEDDNHKITDETTCAKYFEDDKAYYVQACNDGYTCTPKSEEDDTTDYTCVQDVIAPFAYPGEACEKADDCISKSCTSGFCKGTSAQATCAADTECDPGLFCDSSLNKCVALLDKDSPCTRDWQCDYAYYCQIKAGETSGTCTAYFGVASSQEVDKCRDEYFDYQCSTSYCVEHVNESTNESSYYCSEIFSLNDPTQACTADVDCAGTNADKSLTVYSSCSCGFSNDGSAYCELLPGDKFYESYITLAKKWYQSEFIKNCNTTRRGSFDCAISHWDKEDAYTLQYFAYKTQYWSQIWKVETEVQKVFVTEYWEARDEYNENVAVTCIPFVATESTEDFDQGVCVRYDSTTGNEKYYVKSCEGENEECQAPETQPGDYTCVTVTAEKAYPGEKCASNDECASGKCTDKKCVGVASGGNCKSDDECNPGLYCDSEKNECVALLAKDDACTRNWQCDYNYYCYIAVGDTIGKCAEYFNIESGTEVSACDEGKVDLKCSSGFCVTETNESTGTKTYTCTESYTVKNEKDACTSNFDCYGYSADNQEMQSKCTCGLSQSGEAYCELLPGNEAYREYINSVKSWYNSGKAKECNTARRGSLECAINKWDAVNFLTLQYYAYRTEYWTQIWNVQKEVQATLTADYWEAAEEYELHKPVECSSYKCKTSKQEYDEKICSFYDDENNVYYLSSCSKGYVCPATTGTNSVCTQVTPNPYAGPGEACVENSDCITGTCNKKVCVGKASQETCATDTDCNAGLYCNDAKVCVDLLKADAECTRDWQCTYGTHCHIPFENTAGKCTSYMNVAAGTQVNNCKFGFESGLVDYQCATGYCVEEYDESTNSHSYYCGQVSTQDKPEKTCTMNAECAGNNEDKSDTYYGECKCGKSQNGNGYCELQAGDKAYDKYISYYKKWLNSSKNSKCNTARRGMLECAENHWDDENYYSLAYYAYRTLYWSDIQDVASCTKEIYATEYWSAKKDLEDYEDEEDDDDDDDDDSAFSLMFAAIFALLLLF